MADGKPALQVMVASQGRIVRADWITIQEESLIPIHSGMQEMMPLTTLSQFLNEAVKHSFLLTVVDIG